MNIPGEDWKESSVSRRDVVRYIKMKDKLLAMMPWYQTPVECYIVDSVSSHDYVKVACSMIGQQWIKRSQIDVVAILPPPPPPKPAERPGIKNAGNWDGSPPWMDCLGGQGGGDQ